MREPIRGHRETIREPNREHLREPMREHMIEPMIELNKKHMRRTYMIICWKSLKITRAQKKLA